MLGLGNTVLSDYKTVFLDDYSLQLDGTDQYVNCDVIADRILSSVGTVALWIKVETTSSTGAIFRAQIDANNYITLYYHAGSNTLRATYKGSTEAVTATSTTAVEGINTWFHVAMTWSTESNKLSIFLNGGFVEARPNSGPLPEITDETFSVCDIGQTTQDTSYFKGYVNDVVVFNATLTTADILSIYNTGAPKDEFFIGASALIAYFKFETGSGTTAVDSSRHQTHGSIENSPTWSIDTP